MKLSFSTIKGIGLCIIPFALYFVPLNYLKKQNTICLFKNLFDFECWGCGITKAVISTVQFQFADAFTYNKLVVVVFPLLFYLWWKELIKCFPNVEVRWNNFM